MKEHSVRDALSLRLGGTIEVLTPSGCIDCLTADEIIEVKYYRNWKGRIGQEVMSYGTNYPSHKKRLHLFAHTGDTRSSKYFEMATKIGMTYGIHVTFEEVLPGGNDLGANVVYGADVFSGAVVGAEGSGVSMGVKRKEVDQSNPRGNKNKGKKMQDTFDERLGLMTEINNVYVAWARSYLKKCIDLKKDEHPHENDICRVIKRSQSISVVFSDKVKGELMKLGEGKLMYSKVEGMFTSHKTCEAAQKRMMIWENPT